MATIKNIKVGDTTYNIEVSYIDLADSGATTTSTSGTITNEQLTILQSSKQNCIIFDNQIYRLQDNEHNSGILTYSYVSHDSNIVSKTITITISTLGWTLSTLEISEKIIVDITDLNYLPEEYRSEEIIKKLVLVKGSLIYRLVSFSSEDTYSFAWNYRNDVSVVYFMYDDWEFYYTAPEALANKEHVIDEYQRRLDKPSGSVTLTISNNNFILNDTSMFSVGTIVRVNLVDNYDNNFNYYGIVTNVGSASLDISLMTLGEFEIEGGNYYSSTLSINRNNAYIGQMGGLGDADGSYDRNLDTNTFKSIIVYIY